jgi:hypothetical protein
MLRVPFADETVERVKNYNDVTKHHQTHVVMNSVFRLLNVFLTGDSRKNELFMGKHVPFLWDLYGTDMKVRGGVEGLQCRGPSVVVRKCGICRKF